MIPNRKQFSERAFFCLLLGTAVLLSGCNFPSPPEITVAIKPADAEENETEDENENESAATTMEGYGNLVGKVTFEGTPPKLAALVKQGDSAAKDSAVCAAQTIPDESLQVDPQTGGIANVVIYLKKAPKQINPDLPSSGLEPAIFDQKGCRFLPHVLPVRVDAQQQLLVLSDDSIAHNTHTNALRNADFNQTIKANERGGVPIKYTKAENEPIEVRCDYHSWMKAYHFPVDHPYFAVTKADGSFRIEGLPAGKHEFKVWQERGKLLQRKLVVTINPGSDTPLELKYGPDRF